MHPLGRIFNVSQIQIVTFTDAHRSAVRRILTAIGWVEQYVIAGEENAMVFSSQPDPMAAYSALIDFKRKS